MIDRTCAEAGTASLEQSPSLKSGGRLAFACMPLGCCFTARRVLQCKIFLQETGLLLKAEGSLTRLSCKKI